MVYLDFQMDLSGCVSLTVIGRAVVETSVLGVNIGECEGVVLTDTGPGARTLSTTNTTGLTDNIPLDQSVLLARQGPKAKFD